ncbi:peptidoglycan recognition protein family protein [Streptomyces prasinus]|uniref:peptidoglycan recognition protein family protein n=1 Tax=Streptomyces prasinus TaxID=67345 RepID=UPI0033ACB451
MKLITRTQWGARDYRTPNGATPYSQPRRGVKLHYLGTPYSDRAHEQCAAYVRQLQAQHMDGNGWSDIGYSFVVCTHGSVYEGRGLKRRNSANGNTTLNEQDYAVLLLVGSSGLTKPTDAQLDGARDAIEYCRREGPAGDWLGGHRDGYATACPGDAVYAWVKAGAPRPTPQKQEEDPMAGLTKKDIFDAVWKTDALAAPKDAADLKTNPNWQPQSILRDVQTRVRSLTVTVAAQSAAINALAAKVGSGVDTKTVIQAVEKAIKDAVIKVDIDITQNQES